jgi:hypothetical protein
LATRTPTVACKPSNVAPSPSKLIIIPFFKFLTTCALGGAFITTKTLHQIKILATLKSRYEMYPCRCKQSNNTYRYREPEYHKLKIKRDGQSKALGLLTEPKAIKKKESKIRMK